MKLYEVGDLILHPERYENDVHAGAWLIVKVEDMSRNMYSPDWRYHMLNQRTGQKLNRSAGETWFAVERGFFTHVSGRGSDPVSD
mgnify:FL=1|tara:strand:+ start:465 stop:719 length:255 start_codon:yes stop_codon:yes gene_type:complete